MLESLRYGLEMLVLALLGLSPLVYLITVSRTRGKLVYVRIAYLGYAVCALGVVFFHLQLYGHGPAVFMMFIAFMWPMGIGAAFAIASTILAPGTARWILAAATLVTVFLLLLSGVWGIARAFANVVAHGYEVLVPVVCLGRWREWWPGRRRRSA